MKSRDLLFVRLIVDGNTIYSKYTPMNDEDKVGELLNEIGAKGVCFPKKTVWF